MIIDCRDSLIWGGGFGSVSSGGDFEKGDRGWGM